MNPYENIMRVAPSWAPKRAERGPYTGRGASTVGLLGDRTRTLELRLESLSVTMTSAQRVPVQCCSHH